VARYKLADSPLFEQLRWQNELARRPSLEVFKKHSVSIMLLAIVLAFMMMDSVVTSTYLVSFMRSAGIPVATTATILLVGRIGDVLGTLLSGPFADLCKRRGAAYFAIGVTAFLSYPLVVAIISKRIVAVMLLEFLICLCGLGLLHGLAPILSAESFPTRFRYSGTGIAFNLAAVMGGMIPPPLLARLIGQDAGRNRGYVPLVYVVYCAAAMIALLFIRETRDLRMEDLDQRELRLTVGATEAAP